MPRLEHFLSLHAYVSFYLQRPPTFYVRRFVYSTFRMFMLLKLFPCGVLFVWTKYFRFKLDNVFVVDPAFLFFCFIQFSVLVFIWKKKIFATENIDVEFFSFFLFHSHLLFLLLFFISLFLFHREIINYLLVNNSCTIHTHIHTQIKEIMQHERI